MTVFVCFWVEFYWRIPPNYGPKLVSQIWTTLKRPLDATLGATRLLGCPTLEVRIKGWDQWVTTPVQYISFIGRLYAFYSPLILTSWNIQVVLSAPGSIKYWGLSSHPGRLMMGILVYNGYINPDYWVYDPNTILWRPMGA